MTGSLGPTSKSQAPTTTALSPAALRRWILLFVITVGFMARMATFQAPLLDHHSWRQADGATIARACHRSRSISQVISVSMTNWNNSGPIPMYVSAPSDGDFGVSGTLALWDYGRLARSGVTGTLPSGTGTGRLDVAQRNWDFRTPEPWINASYERDKLSLGHRRWKQ